MNITITTYEPGDKKGSPHRYNATFEAVRTVRGRTLGWATVQYDGVEFCFPAITYVFEGEMRVRAVRDWQAPYNNVDLNDPEDVAVMTRPGSQGSFVTPRGDHFDCGRFAQ